MRKLASIQRITNIEPIPGKDRVEVATILGWKVIVQKGFVVGDLCVYCEVDSILPTYPIFEFLRDRCYNEKYNGYRIKAMKMNGIISEGIVFPISSMLPFFSFNNLEKYIGFDVTGILGIRKYDPEGDMEKEMIDKKKHEKLYIFLLRKIPFFRKLFYKKLRLEFPSRVVSKTDETRVQNLQSVLDENIGLECDITEKIDGQSATYFWDKGRFYVCSRNFIVDNKNTTYWRIAEKYNLRKELRGKDLVIQGEIVGPGVQGNKYKLKELDFFVFNIFGKKGKRLLNREEMEITADILGLEYTPYLKTIILMNGIQDLIEMSKGESKLYKIPREGIVIRSIDGKPHDCRGVGHNFSFKVINPDFQMKYGNED